MTGAVFPKPEEVVENAVAGRQLNLPQRARIAVGLSQRRFAKLLGVSTSVISRWETGAIVPSGPANALLRVACAFPDAVLDALDTPPPSPPSEPPGA